MITLLKHTDAALFEKRLGLYQGIRGAAVRRITTITIICGLLAAGVARGQVLDTPPSSPPAAAVAPGAPANTPAPPTPPTAKPPAPPVERKLPRADEGASDPTWIAFRNSLLGALRRGDRATLINAIDRNIVNGLEVPRGVAEFRKLWEIDTKSDRLPRDLSSALNLGSAWYRQDKQNGGARVLCAPYVPIKWPLHDVNPYDSGAIVVKETLVKGAPSHASETLGTLSFDIIGVRDWEVADVESQLPQRWVKVNLRGRDGYVLAEHLRSAIEHRACFAKTGHTWRMVEYVVGIEFLGGD